MHILLVEDDPSILIETSEFLTHQLGHIVTSCPNATDAITRFTEQWYPMVLSDIRMPRIDGIELVSRLKALPNGRITDIVLMTGHADMNTALQALRAGAYDYLQKPFSPEDISSVVARCAEHQALLSENKELTHHFEQKLAEATGATTAKLQELQEAYAEIVGIGQIGVFSDSMREVVDLASRFHQDRTVPVLIEGETGTGKEIVARIVHYGQGNVTTPFITINCSAIPPTLFETELFGYEKGAFSGANTGGMVGKMELAHGGTLFLDEIGDMPLEQQPKLLRAIQEREIFRIGGTRKIDLDIRIICATNHTLTQAVSEVTFREDLYYRLNLGRIQVPPLRKQQDAIIPLAQMFLHQISEQKQRHFKEIQQEAQIRLVEHPWPGNVRELKNAIERVILLHDDGDILAQHLDFLQSEERPFHAPDPKETQTFTVDLPTSGLTLESMQVQFIQHVLSKFDGNKSRTANYLSISRGTLLRRIHS